jgi:hypothetical protein
VFATARPDAVVPESPEAQLRWLAPDEARALVAADNVRVTLDRIEGLRHQPPAEVET